ncbi:hypothetical protein [Muricoccus pecuniae]|uniref:Uncharacterized protein n=1 Tax=Muricoccus pecuniae TaxID=693023 RepID=A0A840YEC9_9PROT|nr:hypothetical protein [Roseomonas pecuniae]MBB5694727.1 hypothetical protein [Roseomonas pecuniae]
MSASSHPACHPSFASCGQRGPGVRRTVAAADPFLPVHALRWHRS